jgi:signal transduction histidine kinase
VAAATGNICPVQLKFEGDVSEGRGDERLLDHIFTNLLTNAVKYSEPGQPVEFTVGRERSNLVCRIRDRGIGIPESDQKWLFNAFHRGENVGQRPGTGLGLTIVKRCVELHGGTLQLESQVGAGTTVTVTFLAFLGTRL